MRAAGRTAARLLAALAGATLVAAPAAASTAVTSPPVTGADAAATYGAPALRCTVTDRRLAALSGLAVRGDDLLAVTDAEGALLTLDDTCAVGSALDLPTGTDVEAVHATADGLVWVGDIGGNREPRRQVAVARVNPASGNVVVLPLAYPDGPHDAETLLVTPSGRVLLVTKDDDGASVVFASPAAALDPAVVTPLERVGELDVRSWPGRTRGDGSVQITDGAISPDGTHVVLRTYLDAFEWDAPDGDVVTAMTTTAPRPVRLPTAPQGEAITYGRDGRSLVVGSEQLPSAVHEVPVRRAPVVVAVTSTSPLAAPALPWVAAVAAVAATAAVLASVGRSVLLSRRGRPADVAALR